MKRIRLNDSVPPERPADRPSADKGSPLPADVDDGMTLAADLGRLMTELLTAAEQASLRPSPSGPASAELIAADLPTGPFLERSDALRLVKGLPRRRRTSR